MESSQFCKNPVSSPNSSMGTTVPKEKSGATSIESTILQKKNHLHRFNLILSHSRHDKHTNLRIQSCSQLRLSLLPEVVQPLGNHFTVIPARENMLASHSHIPYREANFTCTRTLECTHTHTHTHHTGIDGENKLHMHARTHTHTSYRHRWEKQTSRAQTHARTRIHHTGNTGIDRNFHMHARTHARIFSPVECTAD